MGIYCEEMRGRIRVLLGNRSVFSEDLIRNREDGGDKPHFDQRKGESSDYRR